MTPRPLVLLHGFTGSPASWNFVRQSLPHEDVITPTALGHDGTSGPESVENWAEEVDRLAAVIREELPPAKPHLVGYSMGGRLALGLLIRHPNLFASATLIGASPGLASNQEREQRIADDERWARLLETEGLDSFVAAWEALPLWASQEGIPDHEVERQRAIRRSHDPRGLARSLRVIGLGRMPDYRDGLAGVDLPVRLVAGEHDAKFRALAEEMAERLPRATLTVVPDAGHNVAIECPGHIAELLRAALESEDTA